MSESFPQSGGAEFLPMSMPSLNEVANIQNALKTFYYNTFDPADENSTLAELKATTNSIASYLAQRAKYVDHLGVFASTTSDQLRGIISDETGSGSLVFGTSPSITTPTISTPTITSGTINALTGFSLRDSGAAYNVSIVSTSSSISANRTLTLNIENSNKILRLGGNLSILSNAVSITGASGGSSVIFPSTGTVATLDGTENLTNKTLTSPIIGTIVNTGTLTLPTSTDTLVGKETTDIFKNKSISFASGSGNTISDIPNSATTATKDNTPSTIVARDASGNFSAGLITATATKANNLSGGTAGKTQIPYQNGEGVTAYVSSAGAATDYVLTFQGDTSSPVWKSISTLPAVDSASKASNLTSTGVLGEMFFGSSTANSTSRLAPNTESTKKFLSQTGTGTIGAAPVWTALSKSDVGLSNVENTALSTWSGSSTITTVGTIAAGTWNATAIADNKIAPALTGKTYNGLSLTAQTTGFTIAGGTTSKTLTVGLDASVSGTNTGDQTISLTGDVSGSGTGSFTTALSPTGVTAGTYTKLTVDTKGRVTAASTPSSLADTGVSLVASDIPNLSASKITSGTFDAARIPILNQNTTGNAASATAVVSYGGSTGTMSYGTSSQRVYVGATQPTGLTSADIGSIWMW